MGVAQIGVQERVCNCVSGGVGRGECHRNDKVRTSKTEQHQHSQADNVTGD
jgi:hypothetical protein